MSRRLIIGVLGCVLIGAGTGHAEVVIEWVGVGDAGNPGELTGAGAYQIMCGAVDHEYRMAKYEATNGQYREFLNAVAAVGDPNGLYHPNMGGQAGGIARSGSGTAGDPWVYTAMNDDPEWDDRPVTYVNWYDAVRFANWIHNGQPSGAQDETTTENGAYDLSLEPDVVRSPDARVFLPNEDEWYKAAYYKGGGIDAGYWDYATQSDTVPMREVPPGTDLVNGSAHYDDLMGNLVGPPYYRTPAGAYTAKPSSSAYGTFDQNGSMRDWLETPMLETQRGCRGGSWIEFVEFLRADVRDAEDPHDEYVDSGFRLAAPAETPVIPAVSAWSVTTLGLLILVAGTLAIGRRQHPYPA